MKVVMLGGLGNQLFQVAFGHLGSPKHGGLRIFTDVNARSDRPFYIEPLLAENGSCVHSRKMGKKENLFADYRIRLIRKLLHENLDFLLPLTQKLVRINYEKTPYIYEDFRSIVRNKNRVSYGYFQHWKYVEMVWDSFGIELCSALSKVELPEIINENIKDSVVIHIRQGDYRDLQDSVGVLACDYYEDLAVKIRKEFGDKRLIVVTDDVLGAKNTLKSLRVDEYYGPNELGAWKTLKLMTIAPVLVTANSTLSWWGAYIASKSGSQVFMPSPWFKNLNDWPGDAYYFPKARVVKSRFI
jgi:hypothetical protein